MVLVCLFGIQGKQGPDSNLTRMRSIQQLLTEAGSSGHFDSEGVFTIDGKAAQGKLASFQLPRRTAWLLKIVQAAVASGADSLDIHQLRKMTTFTFTPTEPFKIDELGSALTAKSWKDRSATRDLVVGLRAVAFGQGRDFVLWCQTDGEVHLLRGTKGRFTRQTTKTEELSPLVRLEVSHVEPGAGISVSQQILEENRELAWACQASPIQVSCDGVRLDKLASYRDGEDFKPRVPLALIWRTRQDPVLLPLSLPKALSFGTSSWRPTDRFTDQRLFHSDGPEDLEQVGFLARLSLGGARASRVHWVSRGVLCSSQGLGFGPLEVQLDLFLNADSLKTDLSGLKYVSSPEKDRRLSAGLKQCGMSLQGTIEAVTHHDAIPFDLYSLGEGAFVFFHGLIMGLGTKGFTLPFHLYFARSMYQDKKQEQAKMRDACIRHLELLRSRLLK